MITFKEYIVKNQNVELLDRDPKVDNETTDKIGAGALIIAKDTGRVLMGLRSKAENDGGLWGTPGGHVDTGEDVMTGLKREVREETGYKGKVFFIPFPGSGRHINKPFQFFNHIGVVPNEFTPNPGKKWAWETEKFQWFEINSLPKPLLPALAKDIKQCKNFIDTIISQVRDD